ncbi:MAG: hypothetical protein ACT4NP_06200 [Pseudonocardiales bacterium]
MPSRPVYDPWRDVDGIHLPIGCRVEQIAVDKLHGAQPSRLHKHGDVTGRGTYRVQVQFDDDDQPVSIRPHLLRRIPGDTAP